MLYITRDIVDFAESPQRHLYWQIGLVITAFHVSRTPLALLWLVCCIIFLHVGLAFCGDIRAQYKPWASEHITNVWWTDIRLRDIILSERQREISISERLSSLREISISERLLREVRWPIIRAQYNCVTDRDSSTGELSLTFVVVTLV